MVCINPIILFTCSHIHPVNFLRDEYKSLLDDTNNFHRDFKIPFQREKIFEIEFEKVRKKLETRKNESNHIVGESVRKLASQRTNEKNSLSAHPAGDMFLYKNVLCVWAGHPCMRFHFPRRFFRTHMLFFGDRNAKNALCSFFSHAIRNTGNGNSQSNILNHFTSKYVFDKSDFGNFLSYVRSYEPLLIEIWYRSWTTPLKTNKHTKRAKSWWQMLFFSWKMQIKIDELRITWNNRPQWRFWQIATDALNEIQCSVSFKFIKKNNKNFIYM